MKENKMSIINMKKLVISMGLPMILSMVLQALYNVVDTIFIINSNAGTLGNEALTQTFPIQILIIAIGVGTGVGINALLSKSLGEKNKEMVAMGSGNGIFLAIIIYLAFLCFGLFLARPYMNIMTSNKEVIDLGTTYLRICCIFSFGSIGYTVYERFLQSTGKTGCSMVAQISGAVCNMVLDAVFILGLGLGVQGAAIATVIGQILSLIFAMIFHYTINKEVPGSFRNIKPKGLIIKTIYRIGLPAAIMQSLLAVMMFAVLLVIKTVDDLTIMSLLINTYGIYYKIMQMALFACFGLSNTLITIVSFNYGIKDKERVYAAIKWGIIYSILVSLFITLLFEVLSEPIANLFGLSLPEVSAGNVLKSEIISNCRKALRIASLGYVFMGISVGIQGILQGFRNAYKPIIISLLRLIVFVVPFTYLFAMSSNVLNVFWWAFPIAEVLTVVFSILMLRDSMKKIDL